VVNVYGRGEQARIHGFVFRGNLMRHNRYGIMGDDVGPGRATIAKYFPDAVVEGNVLAGGQKSQYPSGNFFPGVKEFESSGESGLSGAGADMKAIAASAAAGRERSDLERPAAARPR
jgi:hypothetical protein